MRGAKGFSKWLEKRVGEQTSIDNLVKFANTDRYWPNASNDFYDFVLCLKERKREELLLTLAKGWLEFSGQETPLLEEGFYQGQARRVYERELPFITKETKEYPDPPLGYAYVYAISAYYNKKYRVRYVGKTSHLVSRFLVHQRNLPITYIKFKERDGVDEELHPFMFVLETVLERKATEKERAYSWYFRRILGEDLLNIQGIEYIYPNSRVRRTWF